LTTGDRFDAAVVGTCVTDILVRPVPLPQPVDGGRLFHVDPIEVRTGGIVCNTGIGLAGGRLEDVAPALASIDLYLPSLDEAAAQTGCDDPQAILARYRELGAAGLLGVKLGSPGTLLSPTAGEFHESPCVPAPGPVIDATGAGDALVAGLVAGIVRGRPPEKACLLGAANAACCVTAAGATAGLRSFAETLMLADHAGGR